MTLFYWRLDTVPSSSTDQRRLALADYAIPVTDRDELHWHAQYLVPSDASHPGHIFLDVTSTWARPRQALSSTIICPPGVDPRIEARDNLLRWCDQMRQMLSSPTAGYETTATFSQRVTAMKRIDSILADNTPWAGPSSTDSAGGEEHVCLLDGYRASIYDRDGVAYYRVYRSATSATSTSGDYTGFNRVSQAKNRCQQIATEFTRLDSPPPELPSTRSPASQIGVTAQQGKDPSTLGQPSPAAQTGTVTSIRADAAASMEAGV